MEFLRAEDNKKTNKLYHTAQWATLQHCNTSLQSLQTRTSLKDLESAFSSFNLQSVWTWNNWSPVLVACRNVVATHGTHTTGIQQQTPQPKHSEAKSLEVTERNNSPWHFLILFVRSMTQEIVQSFQHVSYFQLLITIVVTINPAYNPDSKVSHFLWRPLLHWPRHHRRTRHHHRDTTKIPRRHHRDTTTTPSRHETPTSPPPRHRRDTPETPPRPAAVNPTAPDRL